MKAIVALVALGLGMHGNAVAQVVLQDEGEVRVAQGGRVVRLKVDPKSAGAAQFVVGTELMPPGAVLPTHRHPNQEEVFLIHRGTLTVKLGSAAPKEAPAGAVVFVPKGTCVSLENKGADDATAGFIFPQPGMEDFLRRAMPASGEQPRTREELAPILSNHQHNIALGPC
jgi:quercetin dioxygenase-like cupin family protein